MQPLGALHIPANPCSYLVSKRPLLALAAVIARARTVKWSVSLLLCSGHQPPKSQLDRLPSSIWASPLAPPPPGLKPARPPNYSGLCNSPFSRSL
ncbi:hypothetical protein M440DRAFT_1213437 [Trichoderma longibrachiatum ATCC 18648]|uniref:Uncharacterized protein n=1 Tax=Trichoderma longibrachiatum ATCC 18648 TaxID=983965 RepID=A0A2T4C7F1_TRILO|nr:hypothetical protein M440DRAFT_1213437 [Trichoderma longibrachiatum ATCC 18648]